jgi:Uma2 family endonuclease
MALTTRRYTIEDLDTLTAAGQDYELLRGQLIEVSPTGWDHGDSVAEILALLRMYVKANQLGKVTTKNGFILARNPDVLFAPDIAYVSKAKLLPRAQLHGFVELVPDLVVEVVAPSDRLSNVTAKTIEYLDAGVTLVWLVDPEQRTISTFAPGQRVRTLHEADELDGGDILPGFRVTVGEIFSSIFSDD